jgi:hypothetical protein
MHVAGKVFGSFQFAFDERLINNYFRAHVGEFASLPRLDLLPHWLEVPLHPVYSHRHAVDERERLRVFGEHGRKHAGDNVGIFGPYDLNSQKADLWPPCLTVQSLDQRNLDRSFIYENPRCERMLISASGGSQPEDHREEESRVRAYAAVLVIAFAFIFSGRSFPQQVENEGKAILELGAAADRSLTEGQSAFGPTVAVEVTPIENWLELEAGVTPLFRRHSTEWSVDFLFKKPWTISDKMEFMLGIGPEWIHSNGYGVKMNSVGAEVAPDFMFWPAKKHRFGWYLEPSYEYKFGPGHEHSLGISGGLLISIP